MRDRQSPRFGNGIIGSLLGSNSRGNPVRILLIPIHGFMLRNDGRSHSIHTIDVSDGLRLYRRLLQRHPGSHNSLIRFTCRPQRHRNHGDNCYNTGSDTGAAHQTAMLQSAFYLFKKSIVGLLTIIFQIHIQFLFLPARSLRSIFIFQLFSISLSAALALQRVARTAEAFCPNF